VREAVIGQPITAARFAGVQDFDLIFDGRSLKWVQEIEVVWFFASGNNCFSQLCSANAF
jgi:hypothetical protein